MNSVRLHALTLALCLAATGCSSVLTATRDDPINDNRGTRTIGSTIDDSLIETKAAVNIAKAHPDLDQASHIIVASYNGVVLLAGQTPRQELKQLAEQAASSVLRASAEEGLSTCSSLCTRLTRCTELAACSASCLSSWRGVWPASSTTPL